MVAKALLILLGAFTGIAQAEPTRGQKAWPQVEVDQIEVLGVTVLTQKEVESALELNAGDILERHKVVRSEESFQNLYRLKGYYEVQIQSELTHHANAAGKPEIVLKFTVQEGLPTRVSEVNFIAASIREGSFESYWHQIETKLNTKSGIKSGDIFDQEKVSAVKRNLQDILASEEFVGAKIEETQVIVSDPPGAKTDVKAAHWVKLEFHLDLGDRVTFGFRGNTVFSRIDLLSLVEDQRVIGFGKDYIGAIKAKIEENYKNLGYARINVTPYTFEHPVRQERHITFLISEGPKVLLDAVDFDGNQIFLGDRLRQVFFERASRLLQRGYYVEQDTESAALLVIDWLKSEGYLSAKLITIGRSFLPKGNAARVTVYLYEGDQTIIRNIQLSGLQALKSEEVAQILKIREGAPLNLFAFSSGLEALKTAYRARGYLGIKIGNEDEDSVVRYTADNHQADILLDLQEGPQYRVSRIELEGAGGTQDYVILRELTLHVDDVVEEGKIFSSESRLRKLGIFSKVEIRPVDDLDKPGYKTIHIVVVEGNPGLVAGGFGFRNDLGLRLFGQSSYSNLFQRDQTLSLSASVNRRFENYQFWEGQLQLGYLWPWFPLLGDTTFRPNFTISRTQYFYFNADTISIAPTFEKKLVSAPGLTLKGLLTYSLERTRQFDAEDSAFATFDNQTITIGALIPELQLDMRDHPLSPTRGIFASTSLELADPAFLSQADPFPVGYWRWQGRIDGFIPIYKGISWYLSFRTGYERNNYAAVAGQPSSGQIPLIKQFALGGLTSLRGVADGSINVQNLLVAGTVSYVNYRTQVDFPVAGSLRFGPFLDALNLLCPQPAVPNGPPVDPVYSFTYGLRYGTGFGIHYETPVGPVSFDWGFNLNPASSTEDAYKFYFSIGVI